MPSLGSKLNVIINGMINSKNANSENIKTFGLLIFFMNEKEIIYIDIKIRPIIIDLLCILIMNLDLIKYTRNRKK
jgi:hypothetical protein